jgi:threonylcarbamoyladenosine tRNA methylthiotransferase MtaB
MDFIERLPFSYLHVFSFSARPGTSGESLPAPVESREIRERARALRALGQAKALAFRAAQTGSSTGVIARALTLARCGEGYTEALTGNYLKVRVAGLKKPNQWCDVVLTERPEDVLEPVSANADIAAAITAAPAAAPAVDEIAPALCAHS